MIKRVLYSSFTSVRSLPKNLETADSPLFEREFKKEYPPAYFFQFNNSLVTYEGVVFDGLKVISESLYDIEGQKIFGWKYLLKNLIIKKKIKLDNQEYFLPFNLWHGYGHWIPEVLPRLFAVKDKLKDFIVLLPDNLNPKPQLIESLAPFKFKNIQFISKNTYLKIPNLYMTSLLAQTGNYNDTVMKQLREFLTDFYKKKTTSKKQNIYVSRQKAGKRKIENEKDLWPVLNKFNFKIVYTEMLTYEEQVALFLNCKCLVGLHGAGFSNMIFMAPKTKILEIQNSENKNDLCFFSLASALDLDYYYNVATAAEPTDYHNGNVIVDPVSFEKTLTEMLND